MRNLLPLAGAIGRVYQISVQGDSPAKADRRPTWEADAARLDVSMTVRLRGGARLRFEALCFALWIEKERSIPFPKSEVFRIVLTDPERVKAVVVRPHWCHHNKCKGKVYGAPYCWDHGEAFMVPIRTLSDETEPAFGR